MESEIKTIEQFLHCYETGQRLFIELEFESNESFNGLDLSGTTFKDCWFGADFTRANFSDCKFINCNLKTSDFTGANLTRACITGCAVESTIYANAIVTDFAFENNSCYSAIVGKEDFIKHFSF